jgi:hypothetical protein
MKIRTEKIELRLDGKTAELFLCPGTAQTVKECSVQHSSGVNYLGAI